MHTTRVLKSDDFEFVINNEKGGIEDIFPDFNPSDRLGIVVNNNTGAVGASVLLMAAVTKFYDFYREHLGNENEKLRIYPDFYIFHVGKQNVEHSALDIWPPNKEVVLQDEPEQILAAINDCGITRLIVEDQELVPPIVMRESFNSATTRIKTALVYSPTGRVDQSDIEVTNNFSIDQYVLRAIREAKQYAGEEYDLLINEWDSLKNDNSLKQTFRFIDIVDAICMLTKNKSLTFSTNQTIDKVVINAPKDLVFSPHIQVNKLLKNQKRSIKEKH